MLVIGWAAKCGGDSFTSTGMRVILPEQHIAEHQKE
jgi:hypothetical protein